MTPTWIALYCALWVAVVVLAALVLGLARRVELVSSVATVPARGHRRLLGGPGVGSRFPATLGDVELGYGQERVVVFLSSSCGPCRGLAQSLFEAPATGADLGLEVVLVTDPEGASAYADIGAARVVVELNREVSRQLGVNATPFAIAVDHSGAVKGTGVPHSWDELVGLAGKGSPDGNGAHGFNAPSRR